MVATVRRLSTLPGHGAQQAAAPRGVQDIGYDRQSWLYGATVVHEYALRRDGFASLGPADGEGALVAMPCPAAPLGVRRCCAHSSPWEGGSPRAAQHCPVVDVPPCQCQHRCV